MTRTRIYLILQAVMCILLVSMLSVSAVTIYREGKARKADHSLEPIYTREIVKEKFTPLSLLFFAALGMTFAGLVLGIKDEKADRAVKDSEVSRILITARTAQPSAALSYIHAEVFCRPVPHRPVLQSAHAASPLHGCRSGK